MGTSATNVPRGRFLTPHLDLQPGVEKLVADPWDLLRGKDVFRDRARLAADLVDSDLQHWAPNCCTFSRARERPIPGVANPPIPLRSSDFPRGIPDVVDNLHPSKRRKLDLDTDMADLAADECLKAYESGKFFSLEHPRNSIARNLESWTRLEGLEGVYKTEYHSCMFEGSKRRKSQVLIHNVRCLHTRLNKICMNSKKCSRTGKPHHSWKPRVKNGRVTSFATGEEREYPAGFCAEYAGALKESGPADLHSFLEVFSGPNAPLSRAVALAWDLPPPVPPAVQPKIGAERSELEPPVWVSTSQTNTIEYLLLIKTFNWKLHPEL